MNCITRIWCPTCEYDRKLFDTEASTGWRFSYPRFGHIRGGWVDGLSTEFAIVSAQGVTRYLRSLLPREKPAQRAGIIFAGTDVVENAIRQQPKVKRSLEKSELARGLCARSRTSLHVNLSQSKFSNVSTATTWTRLIFSDRLGGTCR